MSTARPLALLLAAFASSCGSNPTRPDTNAANDAGADAPVTQSCEGITCWSAATHLQSQRHPRGARSRRLLHKRRVPVRHPIPSLLGGHLPGRTVQRFSLRRRHLQSPARDRVRQRR